MHNLQQSALLFLQLHMLLKFFFLISVDLDIFFSVLAVGVAEAYHLNPGPLTSIPKTFSDETKERFG